MENSDMILWIIFCWALTDIERKWGNGADPAPIKDNNKALHFARGTFQHKYILTLYI